MRRAFLMSLLAAPFALSRDVEALPFQTIPPPARDPAAGNATPRPRRPATTARRTAPRRPSARDSASGLPTGRQ